MRENVYTLIFDDHRETVHAATPSEAVARRDGGDGTRRPHTILPHTITDETAMAAWITRRQQKRGG
jgi:hypothetical protein